MDILADTKPENYFVTKDGKKLRNLHHLHKTLLSMSDDVFNHHVNSQRNDFYNWIKDIYQDANLSKTVLGCKTRHELSQKIGQALDAAIRQKNSKNASITAAIKKIKNTGDNAATGAITEKKTVETANAANKTTSDVRDIIAEAKKEAEQKAKLIEAIEKPIVIQQKKEENHMQKETKPKTDKQVFVERPPRTFTAEEKAVRINQMTYMKPSAVDITFGVIIGVIILLIIKQLF